MLFPLQGGLLMQAQPLMQFCLYLQQIHQGPLPWIQEESKQWKSISFFYCLESLSAYTKSFSTDCSCGSPIRATSTNVSFCSFSVPCFCGFSPACLFPAFQKANCWPNPSSTLFRFLTSHTQAFVFSNDVFVWLRDLMIFFTQFLKEIIKQAKFSETLHKL